MAPNDVALMPQSLFVVVMQQQFVTEQHQFSVNFYINSISYPYFFKRT